jgi:Papain-like cysteine protease AvrRpt2
MPKTIRKYWGAHKGRVALNYNWPAIDQDSVVLITASEYASNYARFIGAASITVANIAPHGPPYDSNHGVTFVVNVDWGSPLNIVTDITVLDNKPVETQTWLPSTPHNIGLRMQYQETTEWCWIAVATSINHFYHPSSTWTQCQVMTVVGQKVNGFGADTSGCPRPAILAKFPELAGILADPYSTPAEYALNPGLDRSVFPPKTIDKIDPEYLKSGGISDPLNVTGNYVSYHGADLTLDQIAAEVNAGRPVAVDITWFSGKGSHVVAIAGVLGDGLLILDPANGQSVVRFGAFPGTYFGGATLDGYTFTKA